MVPANSAGISPVPAYSGYPPKNVSLPLRGSHPLRPAFPCGSGRNTSPLRGSYYPGRAVTRPVWAVPLPLAATHGITLVFSSSGYLDVSVPRVRPPTLRRGAPVARGGLPHSETRGSNRLCRSPRIVAAWRVLHRLWEPRHPPCALVHLEPPPGTRRGAPPPPNKGRLGGIAVSAQHVNEHAPGKSRHTAGKKPVGTEKEVREKEAALPERRCSSRTFRYGYLVTT